MQVQEIIDQIPLFRNQAVSYEPLNGGLSNQTYKLVCGGNVYVLRIYGKQTEYLKLTRSSEVDVMRSMSDARVAPIVLYTHDSERYVLIEYVEGRQISGEDLLLPERQQLIINHMKAVHAADVIGRDCSPYHLIESYLRGADLLKVRRPEGLSALLNRMEGISYNRSNDKTYNHRFCHNDFYTFNLILSEDGKKLSIVDWELSGTGDVFFDLAAIPFTNRFTADQEKAWLTLYFSEFEEEQYHILQDMKFINMLRECAWGLLHSGLDQEKVNHEFDYYKHVEHTIDRLQQGFNYY